VEIKKEVPSKELLPTILINIITRNIEIHVICNFEVVLILFLFFVSDLYQRNILFQIMLPEALLF